jgi:thiamine biosynthesis protein ThiS
MPDTERIPVTLNGKQRKVDPGLTVERLLEELGLNPALVVVERNRQILDRSRYAEVEVDSGDVLELVHFVGGG